MFPSIGGSPFLTRIIYEDFHNDFWGMEVYINREAPKLIWFVLEKIIINLL